MSLTFENQSVVRMEATTETKCWAVVKNPQEGMKGVFKVKKNGARFLLLPPRDAIKYLIAASSNFEECSREWEIFGNKIDQIIFNRQSEDVAAILNRRAAPNAHYFEYPQILKE